MVNVATFPSFPKLEIPWKTLKACSTRSLAGLMVLVLVACGVIDTLTVVVVATDALVVSLQASGELTPDQAAKVTAYANAVLAAANCAADESKSTDTDAQKAAKIATCFVQVTTAANILPAGLPTAIASAIAAVAQAIETYLEQAGAPITMETAKLSPHKKARKTPPHYSEKDLAKIPGLKLRIAAVQGKLHK